MRARGLVEEGGTEEKMHFSRNGRDVAKSRKEQHTYTFKKRSTAQGRCKTLAAEDKRMERR